jgi:diguanylate cyclase (GGDEF)-like protein
VEDRPRPGRGEADKNRHMKAAKKSHDGPARESGNETAADLLKEHAKASHLAKKGVTGEKVSVIVLCDDSVPFDEAVLGATPYVRLDVKDSLLKKIKELHEENMKLRSLALIDNLTGLGNKRFFWMQLETEMARTKRTGHPCTLVMIDLDNFKGLNDRFGHLEGDRFLEEFGKIMRDNSRSTDLPCRYGGDEFALVMPATSVAHTLKTAERLRTILANMPQKSDPPVTLSVGVSEYTPSSPYTAKKLVRAADMALYEAKREGRNRICVDRNWKEVTLEENEVSGDEKDALFKKYL